MKGCPLLVTFMDIQFVVDITTTATAAAFHSAPTIAISVIICSVVAAVLL